MKPPKTFKVRPKMAYKLLGTAIELNPEKGYDACWARHIPDWKAKKMIFVEEVLLEEGEYTIIEP